MSFEPLPRTSEYQKLISEMKKYAKDKSKEARLIYGGTSRRTAADKFVIGDAEGRQGIESCLGPIPGDGHPGAPVTVFGMNGKKQAFRVTKDTSGYVFTGDLSIINVNENIDRDGIKLWGYPDQKLSVFVLTVGVIRE